MMRWLCKLFGCVFPDRKSVWFADRIESPPCKRCGRKVVTYLTKQ